jgi:hypothetical protein
MGSRRCYDAYGCRCGPCSAANAAHAKAWHDAGPRRGSDWVNVTRLTRGEIPFREATIAERVAAIRSLRRDPDLTVRAIARRIGTGPSTVHHICAREHIPAARPGRRAA